MESVCDSKATGCLHPSRLFDISRHSKSATLFMSRVVSDLHIKRDSGENVTRKFIPVLTRLADCCFFFNHCGRIIMLS